MDRAAVAKLHAEEDAKLPANVKVHRGAENDLWLWHWGPPRTCSFCGGIHPEDAIRLLTEGWEVEGTTKGYKRYLRPPGTHAKNEAIMASLRGGAPAEAPAVWSPVPPVKLYVQHLTEEQIERFNAALRAGRKKETH
ncbi:MAG: hypothetical protein K2P78_02415 [Gemmataceae bacterium]|nr:hypothetical protein [Gemmataceae bacterium]